MFVIVMKSLFCIMLPSYVLQTIFTLHHHLSQWTVILCLQVRDKNVLCTTRYELCHGARCSLITLQILIKIICFSPTKSEFILAKHLRLAYVLRARRDEPPSELGRQLHSAVRSSSLDTAMRLLAQGADPNYYNQVKYLGLLIFNVLVCFIVIKGPSKQESFDFLRYTIRTIGHNEHI